MDGETGNLQNEFFNAARKDRTVVTIFLANGKKLVGRIKSFDKFTLLLEASQGEQIIFKHAISTVSTSRHPASLEAEEIEVPRSARREG
jgi:host factor-I protein